MLKKDYIVKRKCQSFIDAIALSPVDRIHPESLAKFANITLQDASEFLQGCVKDGELTKEWEQQCPNCSKLVNVKAITSEIKCINCGRKLQFETSKFHIVYSMPEEVKKAYQLDYLQKVYEFNGAITLSNQEARIKESKNQVDFLHQQLVQAQTKTNKERTVLDMMQQLREEKLRNDKLLFKWIETKSDYGTQPIVPNQSYWIWKETASFKLIGYNIIVELSYWDKETKPYRVTTMGTQELIYYPDFKKQLIPYKEILQTVCFDSELEARSYLIKRKMTLLDDLAQILALQVSIMNNLEV